MQVRQLAVIPTLDTGFKLFHQCTQKYLTNKQNQVHLVKILGAVKPTENSWNFCESIIMNLSLNYVDIVKEAKTIS